MADTNVQILERIIAAMPYKIPKGTICFAVSNKIHRGLRDELNRNVKTYKGIKITSFNMIEDGTAYLTYKETIKNLYL